MFSINNLDRLAMVIIESLHQGDEARLEKVSSQLTPIEKDTLKTLTNCWRSDVSENNEKLNDLIALCDKKEAILVDLVIAEKSLEVADIKTHNDYILKTFLAIEKAQDTLEKRFIDFSTIVKIKGFIAQNSLDKALPETETLNTSNDKFIEGYKFFLLGLIYKLKGSRYLIKAENSFKEAIKIFELYCPNSYLSNLSKLHLAFFLNTSPIELSQIADQFKKLGCAKETNLALAQYHRLTKLNKEGLVRENLADNSSSVGKYHFIGEAMQDCFRRLTIIARLSNGHVLILGQEGTGKEAFAHTIHQLSDRRDKPFIVTNCASLKNELFEAEWFGYEKGAFTGADKVKKGILEEANGGMVFLDEIGELTPQIQAKLLTVIQDGVFRRVGSNSEISINIRFIGATNQNISNMIEKDKLNRESQKPTLEGTFRSDLASRLFLKITVPPLNKRKDEIIYLADIFLSESSPNETFILDNSAKQYLLNREYPSNVRSLKNFLECAITYAKQNNKLLINSDLLLQAESLISIEIDSIEASSANLTFQEQTSRFQSNLIKQTLLRCGNNVVMAAKILGLAKTTLYDHIKRLGIET